MRPWLLCVLFLIGATTSDARGRQIVSTGYTGTMDNTGTFFLNVYDGAGLNSEVKRSCIASTSGTLRDLFSAIDVAPGVGKSWTFTLRNNGADTTVTCAISGGSATTCSDVAHEATFVAGNILAVSVVPSGTPAGANGFVSWNNINDTGGETILCGGGSGNTLATTGTDYIPITGQGTPNATETNVKNLLPAAGTLKNLRIVLGTAPTGGASRTFTVRNNGANTSITCAISGAATSCSDTSNTASVVVGDAIDISDVTSSSPLASTYRPGLTFVNGTDEDTVLSCTTSTSPSASATNYLDVNCGDSTAGGGPTTIEADDRNGMNQGAITAIYASADTAPGAGKSYAVTLLKNGSATGATCTLTGTSTPTTCNLTTTTVDFINGDNLDTKFAPAGTPATSVVKVTYLVKTTSRRMW